MIRNGEITFSEAKRIFRHYWWILPIAVIGCAGLGFLVATVLPKRYTSETLVLVDEPTVPTEFVKPLTEDLNRRLASMQEQILSRTRLQPIIEKFGLYSSLRNRVPMEDLIARLQTAVIVKPMESMPGTGNHNLPGFYVEVTFDNAQTAQQICTEITSMFMQQNTREREQQAVSTTSFLNQQLEEAKRKLDDQDQRLAAFKRQYLGSLPEEGQTNLNLLTGMNSQLEANVQALSRAQQDKTFNESLLTQQEATAAVVFAPGVQNSGETPDQQLNALEDQLSSLQARYTPEHPDVVKLRNQIEEFKKRMASVPKTKQPGDIVVPKTESCEVQQLPAKLRQDDLNIADLTKRQAQIQEQITQLQGRLQASPVVEQQLKEITRSYQTAQDFYNELLKKRQQSAMATDLEHQQQSEQFRVLDPPSLPDKPSFPKRTYFAVGGLGAGLALALAIMYLIALLDKSMHTERDVEVCLNMPVLTTVPLLDDPLSGRKAGLLSGGSLQATGAD
jgi:polysaccharide chain length determinant protein (PEP-CTERM system associated)